MRKALIGGAAALFAVSSFLFLPGEGQECGIRTAEAVSLRTADRELKKRKDYEPSDIYERAHHIIYGGKRPYEDRVRIAVVINGDENIVVEERVKNQIYSQLRKKFPRENFAVMKGTDVNTKLLQYAEDMYYDQREVAKTEELHNDRTRKTRRGIQYDERIEKPSQVDVDGVPVGIQPRGLSDMRREDYVRAGKECNYDYVFVMTFSNGKAEVYGHNFILFSTSTVNKNVWMRVRFVDVANENYLYRNDIVAKGESHNGFVNGKVIERSVKNSVREALDDIAIDY